MRRALVCVGLLALAGASLPNDSAPTRNSDGQKSVAHQAAPTDDAKYQAYPNKYADECYKAQSHDAADLCAQWRAAIAAERSAVATEASNYIAGAGAFLTFVSICLLIWTLIQTQRSTKAAEDSAKAARDALGSDRAWITFVNVDTNVDEAIAVNGVWSGTLGTTVNLKNSGRSPATQLNCYCDHTVVASDSAAPVFHIAEEEDRQFGVMGAEQGFSAVPKWLTKEHTRAYENGEVDWYVFYSVDYFDIFAPKIKRLSQGCLKIELNGFHEIKDIRVPKLKAGVVWSTAE